MTPLLTALSSLREASRISAVAASVSPVAVASWNLRIAVFSDDLTALLRRRRFSFCRLRLIWDLMFATRQPRLIARVGCFRTRDTHASPLREEPDYQPYPAPAKTAYDSLGEGAGALGV